VPSLLEDLRWRGLVHQVTDDEVLPGRIDAGDLTLYIGFDPTADSLHVGHLQQLCLLRRFYEAGHTAIALVGGGTGMIGDPSFKSDERSLLDPEQIEANRHGIHKQVAAFVESAGSDRPGRFVTADNFEWLGSANLLDFLRDVGKHFTVNQMVRKDSVRTRLEEREQSLSFTEFTYMLLQAWDFVQLFDRYGCQLQLGGSDQWGNITEGVDLIRRLRGGQAYGLTSPLVTKADGTKFGKTESGSVWLDANRTSPYQFFQFWIRTPDSEVGSYLRRFTFLDQERITELERSLSEHPERREAHRALAVEMTSLIHGPAEAKRAEAAAAVLFTEGIATLDPDSLGGALADAPTSPISVESLEAGLDLAKALQDSGLATSGRDARQLISQGSVYVNGVKVPEPRPLTFDDALHGRWVVLRKGKANQRVLVVVS
jgi:tyrosyl-tRNA synthetase